MGGILGKWVKWLYAFGIAIFIKKYYWSCVLNIVQFYFIQQIKNWKHKLEWLQYKKIQVKNKLIASQKQINWPNFDSSFSPFPL